MPKATIDGVDIAYEVHGAGETLLLVHGWCGTRRVWKRQIPDFARRYRVIAVDLRGHGESDKPADDASYSTAICARDLDGLLGALEIERAVVMGQSMGTLIGQQLYLAYPHRVKALVLAGALSGSPPAGTIVGPWVKDIVTDIETRGLEECLNRVVPFWFSPAFDPEIVKGVRLDGLTAAPHAAIAFCRAVGGVNLRDRLSTIAVPTFLVVGGRDGRTPVEESEFLNRCLPNAWLKVIKDAGHMVNIEKPAEFNGAVLSFLHAME